MTSEIVDGEVVERNLPAVAEPDAMALVPASDMRDLLERGSQQATIIAEVLRKQHLITKIGSRDHIRFEGWVPVATANGKRLDVLDHNYEGERGKEDFTASACVGLRDIRTGEIVARAWASCSRRESNWRNRDDYAIESMAQTRAGGKVCRFVYGWIISLAGFEATPTEEVKDEERVAPAQATPQTPAEPRQVDPEEAEKLSKADLIRLFNKHPKEASAYCREQSMPLGVATMTDAQRTGLAMYLLSLP